MMRYKLSKELYLLIIIPVAIHISLYVFLRVYFYTHIESEPVYLGLIHHRGTDDVELWGIFGDAFDPKAKNVDFDIVIVSATVNPIAIQQGDLGNIIFWQQNYLLHTTLENVFSDHDVYQKAIEEMVVSMGRNGNLVKYFLSPSFKLKTDYFIKDFVHVYFWDIPNQGSFYANTGINSIAVVPIFDPIYIYENLQDVNSLHNRLRDNVYIVIKRAMDQIEDVEDQKPYSVNSVAIPALAGTCCKSDSWMYLDYSTSYFNILNALEKSKIPNPIDRVYIIAYDKLLTFSEEKTALDALFQVFNYYRTRNWLEDKKISIQSSVLRACVWIIPFWILSIFSHRRRNSQIKNPSTRQKFLLNSIALASAYSIIAIPANEKFLEISKSSPIFLFVLDVIFGAISVFTLAWLDNRILIKKQD